MGIFVDLSPEVVIIIIVACALIIVTMIISGIVAFIKKRNSKSKWKKLLSEGKITDAEYQEAIDRLNKSK